jgi:FkbM family methyltransferase
MSFISYAQNLEDVMLYRALKHIPHGFYIDVGAQHPEIHSVTKAFYDRNWRGINVEPSPQYFQILRQYRPDDTNLNVLIGNHQGETVFYEVQNTGLSTVNKAYADSYTAEGREVRHTIVPCTTLDAICEEYKVGRVHFLKIDVEGAEKAVLEGFAFAKIRPWIVVVEANEPGTTQDVSSDWEALILGKVYERVYYDGLNRFYLATEHRDLKVYFRVPPNVFDQYITYSQYLDEQELANEREKKELLANQLQQIYHSHSWRFTEPLRYVSNMLRGQMAQTVRKARQAVKSVLLILLPFIKRHRRLLQFGRWLLKNRPGIKARLRGLANSPPPYRPQKPVVGKMSEVVERLTEPARTIYESLKELYHKPK